VNRTFRTLSELGTILKATIRPIFLSGNQAERHPKNRSPRPDGLALKILAESQLRSEFFLIGMLPSGLRRSRHLRECLLALAALQVVEVEVQDVGWPMNEAAVWTQVHVGLGTCCSGPSASVPQRPDYLRNGDISTSIR
jgi:hypothetical protein